MDRHAWFRARLEAHLSGLLDEREDRAFVEHASGCDDCAKRLAEYAADESPADDLGHLPAGVLAAWPRAVRELRGTERRLVRRHLERCAACRQELELLGHAPGLAEDEALEAGAAPEAADAAALAGTDGAGSGAGGHRRVIVLRRVGGRRWDAWFAWAGWAAAAVVMAAMLIGPERGAPLRERERGMAGGTLAPPLGAEPDASQRDRGATGLAIPVRLEGTLRGAGPGVTRVAVPDNVCRIAFTLPALDIPDTAGVRVQLLDAAGNEVDARTLRNSDLFGHALVLLGNPGRPFGLGRHRLVMRGDPGPGALVPGDEVREFELEFVRR